MMEAVNDPYLRHLFDGDPVFNVYNKDAINMSVGAPGPDLLKQCTDMISNATLHRMLLSFGMEEEEKKEGNFYLFQYGITPGLWECREELAQFLSRRYGDPVKRENLILTCGATHGLQLLLTSVMSPNGIIFVEEVTYMIALDAFKQYPLMKIVTVPMKDDLVDLDAFERIVVEQRKGDFYLNNEKIFWAMFYTVPTYHNPTGMVLPPESCKRLIDIARKNSVIIVSEDVYNLLHYEEGFPPHRLFYYDDPNDPDYKGGHVISNGSFSKILSPAIRFGWIESSPRIVHILKNSGTLCSGGATNHYVSGIITSLLQEKVEDEYLNMLIETYKERLAALCETLDRYLPSCCSYRRPKGGYFIWIHLPKDVDGTDFIKWCQKEYKVSAIPGTRFSYTGEAKNFLRLSIAFHLKETLVKATIMLCKGLLDYIRNHTNSKHIETKSTDV